MSSAPTPPPLPPQPPPTDQWAYPVDEKGEPKKKYVIWLVIGAAGCFVLLLVVGIAATLFVPRVVKKLHEARRVAVRSQLQQLRTQIEEYAFAHDGRYPESLDALALPELPRDMWGHPLVYEPPTPEHREPRVYSLGKDGRPGGTGEDADIHEGPDPAEGR